MIGLFLLLFVSISKLTAQPLDFLRPNDISMEFSRDLRNQNILEKTDMAINEIIDRACFELVKRGHKKDALQIKTEWQADFKGFAFRSLSRDIGDHSGILFLIRTHEKIESLLGPTLCGLLRFHDLYTIAYTLPMVFWCAGESGQFVDQYEYKKHFDPFCGIVAYWSSVSICMVVAGPVSFGCGVAAAAVEQLVYYFVAPRFYNKFYNWTCIN